MVKKRNITKILLGIAFIIVLYMFCSNPYKNTKVNDFLMQVEPNMSFNLDTVIGIEWDTLHIVKPYGDIETYDIQGLPFKAKRAIKNISMDDTYASLIFTKDNNFLYYSIVSFGIVNFSMLENDKYSSHQVYMLDNNRVVKVSMDRK